MRTTNSNNKLEMEIEAANELIKRRRYNEAKYTLQRLLKKIGKKYKKQVIKLLLKIGELTEDLYDIRKYNSILLDLDISGTAKCEILKEWAEYEVRIGNVNTARKLYDRYYKLINIYSHGLTDYENELGKLEIKVGNYEAAKQHFEKEIRLSDVVYPNEYNRGKIYAQIGLGYVDVELMDLDSAVKLFNMIALNGGKDKFFGLNGLGKAYALMGQYDKAKKYFYESLPLLKNVSFNCSSTGIFDLIKYLIYLGEMEEANNINEKYKKFISSNRYFKIKKYIERKSKGLDIQNDKIIQHVIEGHETDFTENLDINGLFDRIKNKLEIIEPDPNFFNEGYYISFDDYIGTIDGEKTKCVRVVTLFDKTNIITMYPVIWYGDTIKLDEKVKKLQ